MSPVTLQVVQDSPSGYLVYSGALDSFWSPLKSRGKRDDADDNGGSTDQGGSGTGEGTQEPSTSEIKTHHRSTTGTGSDGQTPQTSFCSTSWSASSTDTSPTTISTNSTGSVPTNSIPSPVGISSSSASKSSPLDSSQTSTRSSTQAKSHSNNGAIIGGVVGGVVILSIAALILFIFLRRRRRMKHTAPSAEFLHPNSPFQRLNTARSGSPTRTRSVFDMLPSPNSGDAGRKSLLRSLSRRDYKAPPTLEKATVHTTSAVHAL